MIFVAGVLCGMPWGAFQTLTTTYVADVTPIPLRPILTTYVNMCWVIGQLISSGVLRGLLSRQDDWVRRIPYAIQWIFPPPIILGVLLAPESPMWLVRKGRLDDARKALKRLTSSTTVEEINNTVVMLAYTDMIEKHELEGTSYQDCFKGPNLRRTEIACMVWVAQVACGVRFGSNVVYFLQQAGFDPERTFDSCIGTRALALAGTATAWLLLPRCGRRTLYLARLTAMLTILLIVGGIGIAAPVSATCWASGALMMLFVVVYDLTVGPVCYCLVAEIPTTRLRIKTVVLARNSYNVGSIAANFLNPPILSPTAWNVRGKVPATKGRATSELDLLFEKRVKARDFIFADVSVFGQEASAKAGDLKAEEPTPV